MVSGLYFGWEDFYINQINCITYLLIFREFFDVLESCNYLRNKDLKSLKRPSYEFFRDIRDKYRIFYLTGHVDLTNSDSDRGYNPVEAARAASTLLSIIICLFVY